jgi:predicted transcriptional regulator
MPDAIRILISILPVHAEGILECRKLFEFRRVMPAKIPRHVTMYASRSVGRIVGEFEVARVLQDEPDALWAETRDYAGITRSQFDAYFAGLEVASAFEVFDPKRYTIPIDPRARAAERGLSFRPPQSFLYLPMPGLENLLEGVS